MRNAIIIAAFIMVLWNPKILRFDVGFQLSFLALIGISYLMPAIKNFLGIENLNESILSWKENFLTTLSAQLAVAPILIAYFGNFSLVSIIANVLILGLMPFTMACGFILALIGLVSYQISQIFAWFVSVFLFYEISAIKIFGNLNIFGFNNINLWFTIIYYLALMIFISFYFKKAAPK